MVQEEFTEESSLSQPNIIFILADDMSWTSLGDDNSSLIFTTPNLRRLAEKGLVIENYYALQLCNPSRAALLTGRYPLTIGMQYGLIGLNEPWGVHLNETFMSEVFSQNGYATHMLGKWDLGFYTPQYLPTARGFDSYLGYLYSVNYYYSKICPADHNYTDMTFSTTECYYEYNNDDMRKYSTYFYKDHAIDIINNHDTSKPLFLYLAFQAVHSPFIDVFHDMELSPSYLDEVLYNRIMTEVDVSTRKMY
jgi:arylsulfatase A-like enzyme